LLFDIHRQDWSPELLDLFGIPRALLPEVRDSSSHFGESEPELLGVAVPICGIAGDQQAALVGQGCLSAGSAKATYGTGCFMLLNTGAEAATSRSGLLTTTAYRLDGQPTYALEGSIFAAGAAIRWMRDGLGLFSETGATEAIAAGLPDNGGVYLVPAFVGLGAPHWQPDARGLIAGLTFGASAAHLVRAALESVAYQSNDLIEAMARDGGHRPGSLRIDGGMAANSWLCQFLADILQLPIERPEAIEATALGAAVLAGLSVGLWQGAGSVDGLHGAVTRFEPRLPASERGLLLSGWRDALDRALMGG
jgi:glycerol kinase